MIDDVVMPEEPKGVLRIGGYEIEGILGEGGVTETYRARRVGEGDDAKRFAFKLLREDRGGTDVEVAERFRAAAERGQALDDPELVRVVAIAAAGSSPAHFVTELIDGVDCARLVEALAGSLLDPGAIASVGAQIARALAVLHDRDPLLLHGGLAPGNVLIDRAGVVTIADVGVAAALRPITEYAIERYQFVAPELCEPDAVPTVASDLYSLGAVLFFLATGSPPATADTLPELRGKLLAGPPDVPGVPDALAKTIRALLSPSPQARPRTAAAVALSFTPRRTGRATATMLTFDPVDATAALSLAVERALALEAPAESPAEETPPFGIMPLIPELAEEGEMMGFVSSPPSGAHESMFDMMAAVASGGGAMSLDVRPDESGQPVGAEPLLAHVELPTTPERVTATEMGVAVPRFTAGIPMVDPALNPSAAMLDVGSVDFGVPQVPLGGTPTGAARALPPAPTLRRHGSAKAGAKEVKAAVVTKATKAPPGTTAKPRRGGALVGLALVLVVALVALKLVFHAKPAPVAQPRAVAAAAAVAQPPPKPKTPAHAGQVTVVTTPPGATVWIDGEEKGRTPTTVKTKPGGHRLVIVKLGFKMLREVVDTTDEQLLKRTLTAANANFGGQVALKVSCKTEGKYPVFIDGRDTGLLCPVDGLMIAPGQRLVGLFVIPQNKIWSFEREILAGAKSHKVTFNY